MNESERQALETIPITLPDDRLETSEQTVQYIKKLEEAIPLLYRLTAQFRRDGK